MGSAPVSDTQLILVPPDAVEGLLPMIGECFAKVRRFPGASLDEHALVRLAMSGEADLWTFWEGDFTACLAAGLTQRLVLDNGGVRCNIVWLGGGQLKRWIHHVAEIERWAKEVYGATRMRFMTDRHGLTKVMSDYGCVAAIYEKEI